MSKKSAARKVVVVSEASDEDCSADGAKVDQWVVKIVAMARDGDGHAYFLVRWGTDDEGQPFAVGKEDETWEPSGHVQACPDDLNGFHELSRPPLPSEKEAMQPHDHFSAAPTQRSSCSDRRRRARASLPGAGSRRHRHLGGRRHLPLQQPLRRPAGASQHHP